MRILSLSPLCSATEYSRENLKRIWNRSNHSTIQYAPIRPFVIVARVRVIHPVTQPGIKMWTLVIVFMLTFFWQEILICAQNQISIFCNIAVVTIGGHQWELRLEKSNRLIPYRLPHWLQLNRNHDPRIIYSHWARVDHQPLKKWQSKNRHQELFQIKKLHRRQLLDPRIRPILRPIIH